MKNPRVNEELTARRREIVRFARDFKSAVRTLREETGMHTGEAIFFAAKSETNLARSSEVGIWRPAQSLPPKIIRVKKGMRPWRGDFEQSSLTISAKPVGVGLRLSRGFRWANNLHSLTHIAMMESGSLSVRIRS